MEESAVKKDLVSEVELPMSSNFAEMGRRKKNKAKRKGKKGRVKFVPRNKLSITEINHRLSHKKKLLGAKACVDSSAPKRWDSVFYNPRRARLERGSLFLFFSFKRLMSRFSF
jgi:hypothetical protein